MAENNKKIENNKKESSQSKSKGNPIKIVRLRNRFFFMLYRFSNLVFISSLGCLVFAFVFLFIFFRQPIPPQYIPINEDGTYIKLEPLSQCIEEAEVKRFMLGAIKRLYKYDYINFADQIQDAAQFFTTEGWSEYLDEYSKSKTLFAVKENKWIVTVQPNSVPIITKRVVVDEICTWDAKADIQVSYVGSSGQTQKGEIFMRIVRNSVINNPDGLGISRAVFVESKI